MKNDKEIPLPLFDSLENLETTAIDPSLYKNFCEADFLISKKFLKSYSGSKGTFNSYRREVERLIQWCNLIAGKNLKALKPLDIESYINFCKRPPLTWISTSKPPRFIEQEEKRIPNPEWRPFVATISKSAYHLGQSPQVKKFKFTQSSIKEIFPILSTFFNCLLQEEYVNRNPVALIKRKTRFYQDQADTVKIRRLSELQWQYVIESAQILAAQNPKHERTLFIMSALYSLYLRISELTANNRWSPKMSDFFRDSDGNWWFMTVGKGNKKREIAVSDEMLKALQRWRRHLGLTNLPGLADNTPLLPKEKIPEPISSTNYIRRIVQFCFDFAMNRLRADNFEEEAVLLQEATVHWLRHTGISDDVKHRPRDHVRDDAGHSSLLITDRYIDIDRRERHQSAKKKTISETV